MNTEALNSKAYWDQRFDTDWEEFQGREQSRFFARIAIENLPIWFKRLVVSQRLTFCDWGCAEGDGTDVLASYFGPDQVSGVDFSARAIEKARSYYHNLSFKTEDWLTANGPVTRYDIVFSSNTLEHFQQPYDVLARVAEYADKFIVLLLPYREFERHPEHYHTFLAENIPFLPDADFVLVHARAVDASAIKPTYWNGEQVVLIYARRQWLESYNLMLDDIQIVNQALLDEFKQLQALNDSLTETVAEREKRIATVTQAVAERDSRIESLARQLDDSNATNTDLISKLNAVETRSDALEKRLWAFENHAAEVETQLRAILVSRSWWITKPMRFAVRVMQYRRILPADRIALLNRMKALGHRLPLPQAIKFRARALLYRLLGWSTTIAPSVPAGKSKSVHPDRRVIAMRPECCGLVSGLVSIALPVYNQAELLSDSIDSILRQTYQDFELIVINDGSTDGVEQVLERYWGHPKIRILTQKNQKLSKALSNAFEFAQGEYWTWTSADNLMEPRQLELQVAFLRANPFVGMVYSDYYAIDDRGAPLQDSSWRAHNRPDVKSGEIRLPRTTESLNTVQDNFIGPCFMYRGWIGRVLGEYDSQLGVEDYDYWMRLNRLFSIRHLGTEDLLYRYRVHDNTLSARATEHDILGKVQALMRYEAQRSAHYEQSVRYIADPIAHAWLVNKRVASEQISMFEEVSNADLLKDTPTCIVVSAHIGTHLISHLLKSPSIPVILVFDGEQGSPYDVANLLRRENVLAVVGNARTAQRVRLIAHTPVVDGNSGEILAGIDAFIKNTLFYQSTRDVVHRIREPATFFAPSSARPNVLLQTDDFTQGGMENVIIDLGIVLSQRGFNVSILALGKSGVAVEKAMSLGLRVKVCDGNMDHNAYRRLLIDEDIDLVNAHYCVFGVEIAAALSIPFVQTIHNSYVWFEPSWIDMYRVADRSTNLYTCVSLSAAKYADEILGLDIQKMRIVPNGIDPNAFIGTQSINERRRLRNIWGVDANETVFLNVASIMGTKAQMPLVEAFAKVVAKRPECRLVLLGAAIEPLYKKKVKDRVHELGLDRKVIFAGYDPAVGSYYYAADILVLPSFWEGWSLSFGEALYVGMPIVSTNVGAASEFANVKNVLLVEPSFGDITNLNYRNLREFVYQNDPDFVSRFAEAMKASLSLARISPVAPLLERLDKQNTYLTYVHLFHDLIKRRQLTQYLYKLD